MKLFVAGNFCFLLQKREFHVAKGIFENKVLEKAPEKRIFHAAK